MPPRPAGRLAAGVVLVGSLMAAPAGARPYGVEDLLRMEAFGQVSVGPAERRLVFERLRPRDAAPAFDHGYYTRHLRSELFVAGLEAPGPARRLLPSREGVGHVLGPWSPSGKRLLIYRLRDRRWTAGVVDVARGEVRWLPLSPEPSAWGRTAQWRSDDALVMIVRPQAAPPWSLSPWLATERLTRAWSAARDGRVPSRTIVGAGAFAARSPRWPPSRLVEVDATTLRARVLAKGRFHDLELSPTGRYAAVLAFAEPAPVDPAAPFLAGQWPYRRSVHVVDLHGAEAWSPLPARDILPNLLAWSPAGDDLLVWSRSADEDWPAGSLTRLRAGSRTVKRVDLGAYRPAMLETPGLRTPVVAADWLGEDPIIYATGSSGRRDWIRTGPAAAPLTTALSAVPQRIAARARDRLWLFADGGLWEVSRGGAKRLTSPATSFGAAPANLTDLGQRFAFNSPPMSARPPRAIAAVPAGTGAPSGGGAAPDLAVERRLLALTARARVAERVDARFRQSLVVTPPGGVPREVARINDHYADVAFARPRPVRHLGPAGEPLTSWLYLPSADAPRLGAGRPPLIVSPYPGTFDRAPPTSADATSQSVMINVSVLTGAGFAVLLPALPRTEQPGEPTRDLARQVLAAVDAAAVEGGFDPERLALWGHSFGAFAALAIAAQTDRFDAVVAANGPSDLAAAWGEFTPNARAVPEEGLSIRSRAGWTETGQGGTGAPPWADPERYRRNSPLFGAGSISAAVLLIAADRDFVPPSQAESLFTALYRQNKDAVLLTYFGEGHVFESPANIRDMASYALDWLRDRLVPEPVSAARAAGSRSSPSPSSPPRPGT